MKLYVLLMVVLLPLMVLASPLDDARATGQIIETPDGFVQAVPTASSENQALAADVNRKRRAAYAGIAERHGITIEQVGRESYIKRMVPSKAISKPGD
ncbi:MAG: DUF1318 domain-containing protein [Proteobacteria bacterium]|jgi:uncharacterized protein YdbL (DUF1318 family)|nr:DUF1318 domain-containing protein [Pseudomonadota bacterium]MDA1300968.1 DUF1318 domain-containing protein [Pseudomonadota bacterium]